MLSTYLVDRKRKSYDNAVDVVVRLHDRPDGYGRNMKISPFDDTKLSHFEHFSI